MKRTKRGKGGLPFTEKRTTETWEVVGWRLLDIAIGVLLNGRKGKRGIGNRLFGPGGGGIVAGSKGRGEGGAEGGGCMA